MNERRNPVIRADSMLHVDGATVGCGLSPMCADRWECTDHITVNGEVLHVAGSTVGVCGVALVRDESIYIDFISRHGNLTWSEAAALIHRDPRFFAPPTDEEIEAAIARTLSLVQEMSKTAE